MTFFNQPEFAELDRMLAEVEHDAQDNADLVQRLATFSISLNGDLSEMKRLDPVTDSYIAQVKLVHEEIIGRTHDAHLEGLPDANLSADHERDWPYPWGTKSARTVGTFLIAYGFLIKVAELPPSARILEVGCGVGSLTTNLSRMGYRVDSLDPNELQCSIVRDATRHYPEPPNVVAQTLDQWLVSKTSNYKYDAVIFFESFHHVIDHRDCLRELLNCHLEPDAKIILAAEPVFEAENALLPYPWGPRLDGESLRAMRRWGWLELGFTRAYIKRLFDDFSLSMETFSCEDGLPLSQIVIGQKRSNNVNRTIDNGNRYPAALQDRIDLSIDAMPIFISGFSGLSIAEAWGRWSIGEIVKLEFSEPLPRDFALKLELASVFGPNVRKSLKVRAGGKRIAQKLRPIEDGASYLFHFDNVEADELEILIPHPCRPKDLPALGIEDPRRIGIGIRSITIVPR
ncbi:2-polyprenyl-3-methyl-5-hydroxy-6-metoxy-1,4-benzoquinol methylase [Paraburkholderia atlantica]|uniref:class I SAM-dependent methyltransferase n=1 Tax=Paraburkholderia atlantica TaxID=2654982 RepID=UPI00128B995A|nr:methyltransferase domain-containing protein [Paraburkholderia atlantica]MPW04332.1 methyltransferase domain-containing protein [Paraburkholderia atlantica]